jgi:hypothetical protein
MEAEERGSSVYSAYRGIFSSKLRFQPLFRISPLTDIQKMLPSGRGELLPDSIDCLGNWRGEAILQLDCPFTFLCMLSLMTLRSGVSGA